MKKEIQHYWITSILVMGLLFLVGCNSSQASPTPAGAKTTPVLIQTRTALSFSAGNATATPAQVRPTRAQASETPTAVPPTTTATNVPATQTPPVYPTSTISAAGKMTLPNQFEQVSFSQNATSTVLTATNLNNGIFKAYQINATAGQILHIAVNGNVNLQVIDPGQNLVSPIVVMPGYLNVAIPTTGVYTLGLTGLGDVTVGLYLSASTGAPAPNAPAPSQVQAVQIPVHPLSVSFPSKGDPSAPVGYSFDAQAGQTLSLLLTGNVAPFMVAPDGNVIIPETDPVTHLWQFFLPESGKTTLVLLGTGAISVTARIIPSQAVTPLATVQPNSAIPILITAGNQMITLNTVFTANQPVSYVAHFTANQIVTISITGSAGVTKITGPGNTDVAFTHSMYSIQSNVQFSQDGDYTIVLAGSGPSTINFSIPSNGGLP